MLFINKAQTLTIDIFDINDINPRTFSNPSLFSYFFKRTRLVLEQKKTLFRLFIKKE